MTYRVQAILPYFSAIPEDVHVNTWHFNRTGGGSGDSASFATLCSAVAGFYDNAYKAGGIGVPRFAAFVKPLLFRCKVYDLTQPTPRPPVHDQVIPLIPAVFASAPLPAEVAICLSFQGDRVAGQNQARRRGRVYLGALGDGVQSGSTTTFPRVAQNAMDQIAAAAEGMLAAAATVGWEWVVWSDVGSTSTTVTNGWIDNAVDTQRRRGVSATGREVWPSPA